MERRMDMDKRRIKEVVIKHIQKQIKKQEEIGGLAKRLIISILITLLSMMTTIIFYRTIIMFIIAVRGSL